MKKISITLLVMIGLCFVLSGCGGKKGSKIKDYTGYYIYQASESDASGPLCEYYATMEINKDGDIVYFAGKDYVSGRAAQDARGITRGTIEVSKEENKAIFYNTSYEGDNYTNYTESFPLILTLINDGKALYVDSDTNWVPDAYTKVDKKDYQAFCEEHKLGAE